MEETKLKSFIDKLSLKQLDDDERKNFVFSASSLSRKEELFLLNELQNRINIRRAELTKTTPVDERRKAPASSVDVKTSFSSSPEQEEIVRLFMPRYELNSKYLPH